MRDRLIELLRQIEFDYSEECVCAFEDGYKGAPDFAKFFVDYLLDNGVIIPPMKLRQTCFEICTSRNEVEECRVSSITQKADSSFKIRVTNLPHKFVFEITPDKIGKTIFLTKEEAERALTEKRKKNEIT